MKVVIIGGGTAGSEIAWRLRQQNKEVEITILEKSEYTQYSPCALPYVISGEIENFEDIFLFDRHHYRDNAIELKNGCEVQDIDTQKQQIKYRKNGKTETISYDRLILATGCKFSPPNIPGLDQCSYLTLATVDDAKTIKNKTNSGDKALIIGAGYIGMELTGALYKKSLEVTVLEAENRILPANFDERFASKIREPIEDKGIKIITEANIENIAPQQAKLNKGTIEYDHLFICCGLVPDTSLASQAGLECDQGIVVDEQGRTSDENIYACGDAAESINLVDDTKISTQLATTAVRQARVIAENILGGNKKCDKVLNTNISEFDGLIFGSTGVTENYCKQNDIETVSATYKGETKAEYHPDSKNIWVRMVADLNGRIIGCQIAGYEEVAGRLNMSALAIGQGLHLDELLSSETCYNPAIAPIFDPLLMAAEICEKKRKLVNKSN
jgi:NADH oxidase (H2O2-forming)